MVLGNRAGPSIVDALIQNEVTDNAAKLIYDRLVALGLMDPGVSSELFGSGIDGDFTVVGTVVLTEDKYYNDLTVPVGATLDVSAGVRVFVKGAFTLAGNLISQGLDGTDAVANVPGVGGLGGAPGATGPGVSATFLVATNPSVGGNGGGSGAGGAGDGGAGGPNLSGVISDNRGSFNGPAGSVQVADGYGQTSQSGSSGAGDGGANLGGGGGGAGEGAAPIVIFISRGTILPTATITSTGGKGGNGGSAAAGNSGGGSGAGGAGGGGIFITVGYSTTPNTAPSNFGSFGGLPGSGGAGFGTGVGGNSGVVGGVGLAVIHRLNTGETFVF